jgi:hypothetical protein
MKSVPLSIAFGEHFVEPQAAIDVLVNLRRFLIVEWLLAERLMIESIPIEQTKRIAI